MNKGTSVPASNSPDPNQIRNHGLKPSKPGFLQTRFEPLQVHNKWTHSRGTLERVVAPITWTSSGLAPGWLAWLGVIQCVGVEKVKGLRCT